MDSNRQREKRAHPRVPIELGVTCVLRERSIDAIARDISLGGAFLACREVVGFGEEIIVQLPSLVGLLRLPAVVRWRTADGFGVQFGLLGARDTHGILALMKKTAT